jgi:hypothetical protein
MTVRYGCGLPDNVIVKGRSNHWNGRSVGLCRATNSGNFKDCEVGDFAGIG